MFKVGDIITGNTLNTYAYTNVFSTCRVVEDQGEGIILVEILTQDNYQEEIGAKYLVHGTSFRLVTPAQTKQDKFSKFVKRVEERHLKKVS